MRKRGPYVHPVRRTLLPRWRLRRGNLRVCEERIVRRRRKGPRFGVHLLPDFRLEVRRLPK